MVYQRVAHYLWLKGVGKDKTFHRGAERNIQSVIELLGDRPLDEYSSSDAASYRVGSGLHRAAIMQRGW